MSDQEHKSAKKHSSGAGHGHGGGSHEEHEGAPEWLISFADNVTLMMGFFVILLAMNLKPASTGTGSGEPSATTEASAIALDTAIAIREAFNNPVDLGSTDPGDIPLIRRMVERVGESSAKQKGTKGAEQDVRSIRPGRIFSLGGSIGFDHEASDPTAEGRAAVLEIAKHVRGHTLILDIRGNVSSAEAYSRADRGMQLSFDRAMAVANLLNEEGVSWSRLRLLACADSDRIISPAYSEDDHLANRRVEVTVTDRVAELEPLDPTRP